MKSKRHSSFLSGLLIVGSTLLLLTGCSEKKEPLTPPTAAGPARPTQSAEKTSFKEVATRLDPGGNFYLYLGTEQWLNGLSGEISNYRELLSAIPNLQADHRLNLNKVFDVVTRLIKDSGIEDVSGVGMSSIAAEPGLYLSKMILHHYQGRGAGFLWTMFGQKPHALDGLDLLVDRTALAMFSDCDLAMLWSVIQKAVAETGLSEVQEAFNNLPAGFEHATGLKWETALSSLRGEYGLALTLDEPKKIPVPLPGGMLLEVPEPGIMIVAKVRDETIFNRVDAVLKDGGTQVVRVDKPGLKMLTMAIPLPLPIELRPTLASTEGYLILATTDALVNDALAVKSGQKPGLKSTDEFKRLAKNIPQQGNQFSFVGQRLGQTIMRIQQQAMAASPIAHGAQSDILRSFLEPGKVAFSYAVGGNTDEGWVTAGKGNQNPGKALATVGVAVPVGILAAIAIPNFVKARDTAQRNACMNNLRMIQGAKQQWALEKKQKQDAMPIEEDLSPYLRNQFPTCPKGGHYTINPVSESPTCGVPDHNL